MNEFYELYPPLSLAVQPAGALCRAQGELAGVEVGGVALAVVTIVHTLTARPANQSQISIVVSTNHSSVLLSRPITA